MQPCQQHSVNFGRKSKMFDYHMHTYVSFDGHDSPEQVIQAALKAGLKEVCFTDHVDDDPKGIDNNKFTIEAYNAAYDGLEAPGLKIRRGLEFGMLAGNQELLRWYLQQRHFDFVLGSVHYVDNWDAYYPEYWEGKTQEQAERRYMEDTLTCVKAHDDFDVLGHLTYISKSKCHPNPRPLPYDEHREIIDEILRCLAAKGKGMEMNTSGVDRCGGFLPTADIFRRFKELGGEIVTVGSDAHNCSRVGQYTFDACRILQDIFGYVCTFEDRKPIFHKL